DPDTLNINTVTGFAAPPPSPPTDGGMPTIARGGITSVADDDTFLYTTNRTDKQLYVVDPHFGRIVNKVALAGGPDYVRYVSPNDELWVTEPDDEEGIEVFSFGRDR